MPTLHGRARSISSLTNASTAGGNKKAGLFPSVGKDSWTNVAYGITPGHCSLTLACVQTLKGPLACVSRPVGISSVFNPRFKC